MDGFSKYIRQTSLDGFGEKGQQRLLESKLVMVGVGGIGSAALPLIAGAGVGKITIIDCDVVYESNLHRQVIYSEDDLGMSKAEIAAKKISKLNNNVEIEAHNLLLEEPSALEPFLKNANVCIDATDSFFSRFLVSDACKACGIPDICASAQFWTSQLVLFAEGFYMREFLDDPSAIAEKSKSLPIFGPAASLGGVWAAACAIRFLADVGEYAAGSFRRYCFEDGKYFEAKL